MNELAGVIHVGVRQALYAYGLLHDLLVFVEGQPHRFIGIIGTRVIVNRPTAHWKRNAQPLIKSMCRWEELLAMTKVPLAGS
jgi:hypothetical protein